MVCVANLQIFRIKSKCALCKVHKNAIISEQMKEKHIVIIGAGPGGLATAMLLSHRGFRVSVYEKAAQVGGRNGALKLGDYTFDIGPTFFVLPEVLESIFTEAGANLQHEVKYTRLEPMYRLMFEDREMSVTDDREAMAKEIERVFPGQGNNFMRYMEEEHKRFKAIYPLLEKKYTTFFDFISARVVRALPYIGFGKTLIQRLAHYFEPEELQLAFTFQSKYLGMSPWNCPAFFSILPYIEHRFGVYHVEGGLHQLSKAMARVAERNGAEIHLNTPVREIQITDGKAHGVILENAETIEADEVVVNADISYALSNLFPEGSLSTWKPKNLEKKTYSCSTYMLYLCVDKQYDIPHNTIVFSNDYKGYVESIEENQSLVEDISFYIGNTAVTDSTMAPEGHTALYVLVPVPNNRSKIDWDVETEHFRENLLDLIEKRTELSDLRAHITQEKIVTPRDWEVDFNVFLGAVFNIGHQIKQMLVWRPRNKFTDVNNVYIAGGGTHPGSGLPTIYDKK